MVNNDNSQTDGSCLVKKVLKSCVHTKNTPPFNINSPLLIAPIVMKKESENPFGRIFQNVAEAKNAFLFWKKQKIHGFVGTMF